jgi:hypothetical protein
MSQADLNALEREVELTRARFADDLARLRSPRNLAAFKEDLWAQARETKDEMIDKTKEAAGDAARRILAELKARAAANPAAALALGAGLAWRLVHRPPIATLLVGVGLVGLLRTSPSQTKHDRGVAGLAAQTSALADAARRKVLDWGAQASDAAREVTTQIAEKVASAADRTSDALHDVGHTTRESVARVADNAAFVSDRASSRLRAAIPSRDDRDTYLLGAAALAVTAAVGIAFQRRAQEDTRPPLS